MSRHLPRARRSLAIGAFAAAMGFLACVPDGGDGVGGVLVVGQVLVDAGTRDVLVGGTRQLTASPRTTSGIVVPNKVVTWSSSAQGIAQVDQQGLVRGINPGTATIRATVDGVTGQVSIDVRPVPVASVEVTLGETSIVAGATTTAQATAFDSVGGVLAGRTFTWSSTATAVATITPGGLVTAVTSGTTTITATVEGRVGSAPLTVQPRSAVRLGFVGQPGATVAGQTFQPPVRVAFQDGAGATATEASGQITLSFGANPTGTELLGTLTAPAVAGVATFADLRIERAGQPYTLQASAPGMTGATSAAFVVSAGPAAALAIVTPPAGSAASGAPLVVQPVVELRDGLGNPVLQAGIGVTASVASGPGALGGQLTVLTNAAGRAVFTDLAIIGAVGSYTLRFHTDGLTDVVSAAIGLGAGGASQLTFSAAPPATAVNAQPLAGPVRIQLRDATGNPVAQVGTPVSVTIESGAGVLSGTLSALTTASGEAVFDNLVLTGVLGSFTLRFASPGLTPAISNPIALAAGIERSLAFVTVPPLTAINGATFVPTTVVQLRDVSGNAVAKAGVNVLATVQSPVTGLLQGTLTQPTDAAGQASFPGLAILGQVGLYTLTFRSGALSEAIAAPLQLLPGPLTGMAFATAPPLGAASGVALTPQPVVRLVDQSGNAVASAGVAITVALASGPGLLSGTLTATTNASGSASFTGLTLTGGTGAYVLRFTATGLPALLSGNVTVGAGAPTQLTFTTAPPSGGTNGVALAPPVVVQLRDGVGNPVAAGGVTVTASLTAGPGLLGGTVAVQTDAGGSATFSALVLTGTVGSYTLTFAAPGLTSAVSNPIALTAGPATQLTFTTAPPASGTNGADLAPATVIQLRDISGNAVSQAGVSVTAGILVGAGGTLSGSTVVSTDAAGVATFGTLRITGTAGAYTLRFTAPGLTAATANPLTLLPGPATALAMQTQPPPSATSGVALAPQPSVRLVDQSGNLVATSGVIVTASLAGGPGTLGGTLTATTSAGVATFTDLAITGSTGSYTIGFAAPGVAGVTSGTIGLGAGAAAALQFVGTPASSAIHGVAISPSIAVRLVDGSNNPVAQAGVVVGAVLASGPGNLSGTVSATTDASGAASFGALVLTGPVGAYAIRFEVSGISPVTTPTIALAAGAADRLALTTAPSGSAVNGMALATQPVVQIQDASGNPVSQSGTTVTATVVAGPGAVVTGGTAVTGAGGAATFSGLTLTGTAGPYTLSFSAGGLTAVQASVSLTAGAATALVMATQPSGTATSGITFPVQPVVRLVDQSGNLVSQAGVGVTAQLGTVPGPAVLGGTTTVSTGADGRAVFTDLVISGTAGAYDLDFSAGGLAGVTSATIAVAAGAATQLVFVTAPPAAVSNGSTLAPPVVVRLADGTGNPVAQSGVAVQVGIAAGAGAVLTGTTTQQTDGTGQATFGDLVLTGTAGSFTLEFTSAGLTPASAGVGLVAGAATRLAFTTVPPVSGTNGVVLAPPTVVVLHDQSGNLVATSGTDIVAQISAGPSGTLSGTLTRPTAGGSASFDDLVITGTAGNYVLQFTSVGLTAVSAPAPLALGAGPATQLGFAVAPPASATSGAALTPQPAVQVRDQSGNAVAQAGHQVTAAVSAGASVTNATATTDAGGLATFSGLTITGPASSYTLTFSAAGFPDLVSGSITVGAGVATELVFITAPPGAAVNGVLLAPQPVLEIRDGSGSPVLVAGTPVTASVHSGNGTLAGTTTVPTAADGRATFTNLTILGEPGAYVLRFTTGVLPPVDGAVTLSVGPATQLLFDTAPPASATNGAPFPASTIVFLADVTGNLVPTDGVGITVSIFSGPGAVLGGTTLRTTVGGEATFNDLVLTGTAGNYVLDFTTAGLTKAQSNPVALGAGPATKLEFLNSPGIPATGASGVALSPAPAIQLLDASNNPVPQAGVTITAGIFSPSGNGALLSGGSVATGAGGTATFSALTITGPAASYVLTFTSVPLTGLVSPPVAIGAGAAVKLAFITTPSATATNGQALAQQPVVELRDAADNPVAQAGVSIGVAIGAGAGVLTGTALTVATDGSGRATFDGLTITGTAGIHTLQFSGTGLTTLVSGNVDVVAGAATAVAIVTQPPGQATSGALLSTDPEVRLVDQSGNAVAQAGVDIDVVLTGVAGGTLSGTTTRATDAAGVAEFTGLGISGPAGDYQLEFRSTGLTTAISNKISLIAASGLQIATQPSASSRNDQPFAQQPSVQLVDGANAPVALAGVEVTAAIASGGGALIGAVTATTNASGVATFATLGIRGVVGTRTIEFTAPGLASATSADVDVTPGLAMALAMVVQPADSTVDDEPLPAAPEVRLLDVSGNQVDSTGVDISVAVAPAGATLGGTTTRPTAVGGIASFPGLSLGGSAGSYTLNFTGSALAGVSSDAVTLVVPVAVVITIAPPASAVDDVLLVPQPTVRVDDGSATPIPGVTVTVELVTVSGAGTLAGTLVRVTGSGGEAAWTDLKIQTTGAAGQFRLRFRLANGVLVESGTIDIP